MALVRFINNPKNITLFNTTLLTSTSRTSLNQIGRWSIPSTYKYQENAAMISDRANEDHCGGCGDNLLTSGNSDINYVIMNSRNNILADGLSIFQENERYYFPFTL